MQIETAQKKMKRVDREPPLESQFTYSIDQVARMTSLSRTNIAGKIKDGKIGHIKIGTRVLILKDQVEKFLANEAATLQQV